MKLVLLSDTHQMQVLVTGASGFIGKRVVQYLYDNGYTVRALVRTKSSFAANVPREVVVGNMKDFDSLVAATEGVYSVVHLAAAKSDESDSYETNVEGARHLVKACEINDVKSIINISTSSTKIEKQ